MPISEPQAIAAGLKADALIKGELERQDAMWGVANNRADASAGQLFRAGLAQAEALEARLSGETNAFASAPAVYPTDWSGFRDYGSDVANLVVAVAFLRQEIKRKIANGEDTTRTSRNVATQPYTGDQPAKQLS